MMPQYPVSRDLIIPVDPSDKKKNVSPNATAYKAENRNALAYLFSAISNKIGSSVTTILMVHCNGVVALIITIDDTIRII